MTEKQLSFFNANLLDQIKDLYANGSFVTSIRYYGHKVNLYLIYGSYVEVFYNHKFDKIDKIIFLEKNHSRMKFYADQVKLPELPL